MVASRIIFAATRQNLRRQISVLNCLFRVTLQQEVDSAPELGHFDG